MKRFSFLVPLAFWTVSPASAQEADPGPYYFVSDEVNAVQFCGAGPDHYGGVRVIENLNLLARVLGDVAAPPAIAGAQLVPTETMTIGSQTVTLQPFAFTVPGSPVKLGLPIGARLRAFLDDPLGGARFDLTLPFTDSRVGLSDRSALLRIAVDANGVPVANNTVGVWHTATDWDRSDGTKNPFDVVAPADGIVLGNNLSGVTLTLKHTAANGVEFLTVYSHLKPSSKSHLAVNTAVKRGDVIGRVEEVDAYTHLHMGLAVKPRGPALQTGLVGASEWYLIDPFGVYDYRRDRNGPNYNYISNNTLSAPVRGIRHAFAFRTNPVIGSLLLPEDCMSFNPATCRLQPSLVFGQFDLVTGSGALIRRFPNLTEAARGLRVIRDYGIDQSCRIGGSTPSFTWLLRQGAAPIGALPGEDSVPFHPGNLSLVTLTNGQVRMLDGASHAMFTFPNMLEAGNSLSVILKYGFNRVVFIGRPGPSMTYLRR